MIKKQVNNKERLARHARIREKLNGTATRPRLCVFRSNTNIYTQIIDDEKGCTLVAASSLKLEKGNNIEAAKQVGVLIAKAALEKNIVNVVFDRGGYIYHGRVKALAEAARNEGLKF